jgi:hypothetical protein
MENFQELFEESLKSVEMNPDLLPKNSERAFTMNDARNFFVWLIFMAIIYVVLAVLETALEVPDMG